jgi:hypothetical protein
MGEVHGSLDSPIVQPMRVTLNNKVLIYKDHFPGTEHFATRHRVLVGQGIFSLLTLIEIGSSAE